MCRIDALKLYVQIYEIWRRNRQSSSKSSCIFFLYLICGDVCDSWYKESFVLFRLTRPFCKCKIIIFVDSFKICSQSLAGCRVGSYYFCWNWNYYCVTIYSIKIIIFDCDNNLPCAYNYYCYYQLELLSRILCLISSIATANSKREMHDKLKRSI